MHDNPEAVAVAAAERIAYLLAEADEPVTLGLAGGSTPSATYRNLRAEPVSWDRVVLWLSDERWVPPDHERSNGRMAEESLVDHVGARFVRPGWAEEMTSVESADGYDATLRDLLPDGRADLVLLGMGEDAHTASLFPGSDALAERERWFVANEVPVTNEQRLTVTYPLLWRARRLMVITAGAQKAQALRDSFEGSTPAGWIGDGEAKVEWHVDRAAASLLS